MSSRSPGIASVADRQAALRRRFDRWVARSLDTMLDAAAAEFPDRPYVVTNARTWTYEEVRQWSVRIARGLVQQGVRPGDHVAVVLANYPEFVALRFAIARVGAVCVPINFLNRRDELGYVLKQSDASLLVTMDRFRGLDYLQMLDELAPGWEIRGGGESLPRLRQVLVFQAEPAEARTAARRFETLVARAADEPFAGGPADPAAIADIIYTSGTTGSPKGVMLTHDMLLRTAFGSAYARAFEDGRRIVFSLPMYHVYGYVEGMLSVLFVGGAIVPQLRFDAAATLRGIEQHRATDVLLIPTMTLALLEEFGRREYDLSSLLAVISSGGRSPAYLWQCIFDVMRPHEVTTGYGMTEVTASSTVTRPDDPLERLLTTNGRLRDVGPAGDPALGDRLVVYRVVDPQTGVDVAPGEAGELLAKGPGVTSGYYSKPEATAEAFTPDGWFRTGDLGRIDADDYVTLVGRRKESYRCGGEQVMPTEIEDLLVLHPAVLQAHVVPVPDDRMGEIGVAFVVLRDGVEAAPDQLVEYCAQRLARFKVPRHVLFVRAEEVPTTPSGRARKFLLSERANELLGRA